MARQQPHLGELTLPARLGDSTNVRWHDAATPAHRKRPYCCKIRRQLQTAHDSKPIFRSFLPPPGARLPTSYNGIPSSLPLGTGSLWATTTRSATFPSVQNDLRAPPAQRDDGDRHALPSRHRHSQAATAPAVVAAWQSTWAHLPPMASVCRTPDASTLQRTARATLSNVCELRNSTSAIEAANTPVDINSKTPIS